MTINVNYLIIFMMIFKNENIFFAIVSTILLFGTIGCRTPMPPGGATSGFRLGPFFESASDDAGNSMVAVRPFFSRESSSLTNEVERRRETDILWPLGVSSVRDDHYYWRALLLFGTGVEDDPSSPEDPYRFRLYPFIFMGRSQDGGEYSAFFPFGGRVRDLIILGDVKFFLFPIFASGKVQGAQMTTFMWPFYLTRHGKNVDQFRLWPFYGESEHRGFFITRRSHFIAWPFWSETEYEGQVSGSGFVLFPIFGHAKYERKRRGTEESWTVLPPFFTYGRGDDGYRRLHAPWPFIRIVDADRVEERHYWPLYGSTVRKFEASNAKHKNEPLIALKNDYLLWPLFRRKQGIANGVTNLTVHAPIPFYFHREASTTNALDKLQNSYTRLWPIFSYRENSNGKSVRFPELSLWSNSEQIERNWAPLWSLYAYRKKPSGAYCNDLLWGFLSWGRNDSGGRIFSFLWIPFLR